MIGNAPSAMATLTRQMMAPTVHAMARTKGDDLGGAAGSGSMLRSAAQRNAMKVTAPTKSASIEPRDNVANAAAPFSPAAKYQAIRTSASALMASASEANAANSKSS